jgi:mannitol/fructose-specific phosphotransferase system IIA component (Ntr-type)
VHAPTQPAYWKLFKPKACSLDLEAEDKPAALAEIVQNLVGAGSLPAGLAGAAVGALTERERMASTGVGQGVAIPHVELAGIERAVLSLSLHKQGVDWAAIDGGLVHVCFTVLRPREAGSGHDPKRHLEMMRWISRLARERDFRIFALQVKTRTELVDLLKEMSNI